MGKERRRLYAFLSTRSPRSQSDGLALFKKERKRNRGEFEISPISLLMKKSTGVSATAN
jgi:hypothetical protein